MKVVHSYVGEYDIIWKELLYSQYLSAVLANKHYGNISFAGTKGVIDQVEQIGIPYNSLIPDVVKQEDFSTWSIPKLKVFSFLKEPFLHIDNDTFIFDKIDFQKYQRPFIFSHPDMNLKHFGSGYSDNLTFLIRSFFSETNKESDFYFDINNTYLRLFFKLIDKLDESVLKNFDLRSIPNMNLVYVEDYITFNKVSDLTLKHYYQNKAAIDKELFGPCYVEQLMLHQMLRVESKQYRKYSKKLKHVVFKKLPLSQKDQHNNTVSIDNITFPLRYDIYHKCKCCNTKTMKLVEVHEYKDLLNFLEYDFEGFLHSTYHKWYDVMQAYTIHQLKKEIGDDQIRIIHKYFKEKYPNFNLPVKSGGEKLYEKLTGFSFE